MKISIKRIGRKRLLIGGGILVVALVLLLRGGGSGGEEGEDGRKGPPVAVQVAEVRRLEVEQTVTAAGKIRPVFETEISSTVSAQIMELRVDEGFEVEVGDTLAILDRLRYEAAYDRARSSLRSAEAGLRKITAERGRGRQLFEKNLISLQEMEALEASFESAESQVDQAKATQQ
ncbi:MAG: biotin/lipoyl-binding protein, partial [Candidatus Neomarinimicrobiota bacterium]